MTRTIVLVLVTTLAHLAAPALAWGPHPAIGMAAVRTLDKDDPFRAWVGNVGLVGPLSWWNDFAGGYAILNIGDYQIYSRDCFEVPGLKMVGYTGHGGPETGTYEVYFPRLLQAMHTETPAAAMGWLGAVLHDTEDTGAPPHAAKWTGKLHASESWAPDDKVDITGYKPKLLGKTEEEACKGYVKRVMELHEFSLERTKKLKPLIEKDDRAAADPIVMECANESARAVADVLHTLGYLHAKMKPIPGTAGLSGTVTAPADPDKLTAKILLEGTRYSTFADLKGHYEFRNLPPAKYNVIIMMPRCKPVRFEANLEADKTFTKDVKPEFTGNLVRNGDFSVRWISKDQPDNWYCATQADKNLHCTCQPFNVKPGQKLQVKITWAKDADGQANIVWEGKWDKQTAIGPDASVIDVTVPDRKGPFTASVSIRTKGELQSTVENVSVMVVSEPATQPGK